MWETVVVERFNYWIYVILMMIGLYAMVAKTNMIKKLIGMSIFQTAIMLFYVSIGVKKGASIPILMGHGDEGGHGAEAAHAAQTVHEAADTALAMSEAAAAAQGYANPLPHVLMLTAIVVGVGTLGVAMAVVQRIYAHYGSIEEDEVLKRVKL